MAATTSTMLPLGTKAPTFALPNIDGTNVSLDDAANDKPLLVMFICNHCPYVKHVREELAAIGKEYIAKGVSIVAINSNDAANYPDDSPSNMIKEAREAQYVFPYLYDESQKVAKAYTAACTPDFFVFDKGRALVYRGQLDDSRPGNGVPVTGRDLRLALDAVLAGRKPSTEQKPSMGCNIKWKSGNSPDYA